MELKITVHVPSANADVCVRMFSTPALSQGAEENAFCAALQVVLDTATSSGPIPQDCSLNHCTTFGGSYNCILVYGESVFESQSTIELCTEPPRYELVVRSGGSVVVDETVSESSVITTPLFNIDITLNVSSNGFGVGVIITRLS